MVGVTGSIPVAPTISLRRRHLCLVDPTPAKQGTACLFLQLVGSQRQPQATPSGSTFANAAGLAFIAVGVAMIVISGFRFARTTKEIQSENDVPSTGERFDLALAALIGLLGISLFLYLSRAGIPAE